MASSDQIDVSLTREDGVKCQQAQAQSNSSCFHRCAPISGICQRVHVGGTTLFHMINASKYQIPFSLQIIISTSTVETRLTAIV